MTKRLFAHLLIACVLLLAQQGALAHAISHAFYEHQGQPAGDAGGKGKLPHSLFCAHWSSYTGLHAASSSPGLAPTTDGACVQCAVHCSEFNPASSIRAFQPRAPPIRL